MSQQSYSNRIPDIRFNPVNNHSLPQNKTKRDSKMVSHKQQQQRSRKRSVSVQHARRECQRQRERIQHHQHRNEPDAILDENWDMTVDEVFKAIEDGNHSYFDDIEQSPQKALLLWYLNGPAIHSSSTRFTSTLWLRKNSTTATLLLWWHRSISNRQWSAKTTAACLSVSRKMNCSLFSRSARPRPSSYHQQCNSSLLLTT